MVLRVIRDKRTKAIRAMWEVPATDPPTGVSRGEPVIDCQENEEYVELEDITHEEALLEARESAGVGPRGILGKIHVHDDRIVAHPVSSTSSPTMAGEIRKRRRDSKKAMDAPVTLAELEAAEEALNG